MQTCTCLSKFFLGNLQEDYIHVRSAQSTQSHPNLSCPKVPLGFEASTPNQLQNGAAAEQFVRLHNSSLEKWKGNQSDMEKKYDHWVVSSCDFGTGHGRVFVPSEAVRMARTRCIAAAHGDATIVVVMVKHRNRNGQGEIG